MLNVIKVKLLSERTSGVPPVIFSSDRSSCSDDGLLSINPIFQNFTQSIDAIDVTRVTLSCLNNIINAIDVTMSNTECQMSNVK